MHRVDWRRSRAEGTPLETILTKAMASKSGIRTATRQDLIDDEAWYLNPFFQHEPVKVRMDDFVTGVITSDLSCAVEDGGKLIQMFFCSEQKIENLSQNVMFVPLKFF